MILPPADDVFPVVPPLNVIPVPAFRVIPVCVGVKNVPDWRYAPFILNCVLVARSVVVYPSLVKSVSPAFVMVTFDPDVFTVIPVPAVMVVYPVLSVPAAQAVPLCFKTWPEVPDGKFMETVPADLVAVNPLLPLIVAVAPFVIDCVPAVPEAANNQLL